MIVGGLAIAGNRAAERATTGGNVWILYPFSSAPGQRWVSIAWVVLGLVGVAVQTGMTGKKKY
jgi:hypothetical protein